MADPNNGPILENESNLDLEIAETKRETNRDTATTLETPIIDSTDNIETTPSSTDDNDNAFTGNSAAAQTQRLQSEESGNGNYSSVSNGAENKESEEEKEKKNQTNNILQQLLSKITDIEIEIADLKDLIAKIEKLETLEKEQEGLKEELKDLEEKKVDPTETATEQQLKVNQAEDHLEKTEHEHREATQALDTANIINIEHEVDGETSSYAVFIDENGQYYIKTTDGNHVDITDAAQIKEIENAASNGGHFGEDTAKLKGICDDHGHCKQRVKDARISLKKEKQNLRETKKELKEVNEKIDTKQERLNELETEISELKEEIKVDREELGINEGTYDEIKTEAQERLRVREAELVSRKEQVSTLGVSSTELKNLTEKMKETISLGAKDPNIAEALENLEKEEERVSNTVQANYATVSALEHEISELQSGQTAIENARDAIEQYQDQTRAEFLGDNFTLFSVSERSWLHALTHPLQDEDGNFVYSDEENRLYRMEENPETGELERAYYDPKDDPVAYAKLMEQAWAGDPPKMFANETLFNKDPSNQVKLTHVGDALAICDKVKKTCELRHARAKEKLDSVTKNSKTNQDQAQDDTLKNPALTPDEGQMAIDMNKDAIASAIAGSGGSVSEATLKEMAKEHNIPKSHVAALTETLMSMDTKIQIHPDPLAPTIFNQKSPGPKQAIADLNKDLAPHAKHVPINGTDDYINKHDAPSLSEGFGLAVTNTGPKPPEAKPQAPEPTIEPGMAVAT